MPFEDILDELEDIFDEIEDLFEDFVDILIGKKSRKKLERAMKKYGNTRAVASLGALAFRKWSESGKQEEVRDRSKNKWRDHDEEREDEIEIAEILSVSECLRVNMVLAMISAAGADGKIDRIEMLALTKAIEGSAITDKDKAMLTRVLMRPPTLEEVAGGALSPLEACELYAAAWSAIEEDTPSESLHMRRFAKALALDDDLVETIHGTLELQ